MLPPMVVAAKDEGKKLRFSFKGVDGVLTSFSGMGSKTSFQESSALPGSLSNA